MMEELFDRPDIVHKIIEIMGNNFSYEEILVIGRRFASGFDIRTAENQYGRLRLPPYKATEHLIDFLRKNKRINELVKFIIDLDCHSLNGRKIILTELEDLLIILRQNGICFDFRKRKFFPLLEKEKKPMWEECLHENKKYNFSYVSVDIVKSSEMANEEDLKFVEYTVNSFFDLIKDCAHCYNGAIWSWEGDGGIITFWGDDAVSKSVLFSIKVLGLLPLFNVEKNRFETNINLRVGIDSGKVVYRKNKGKIISSNINFAAHLQKKYTDINSITISEKIYNALNEKQRYFFYFKGDMENKKCFSYSPYRFYMESSGQPEIKTPGKKKTRSRKKRIFGDRG